MKLGKEEIQKLVLGVLLFISLIYGYFTMLLGPLKSDQEVARKNIVSLDPEIAKAKEQIEQSKSAAVNAPQARTTVAQVHALIPDGAPVAWFPPRVAEFFKGRGVDRATTRLNNEFIDNDLPGFRRLSWGIVLPKVDFTAFAGAVAQLENEEPLIEITNLQIETSREDVESQQALLTVNNIVKQ